jgi:hypothetical protein
VRIAPVPKVAGGTTIGGLAAYGLEVAIDYGADIKPSLAAWIVLLVSFTVAWLIPGEDGPLHEMPHYPRDPTWADQKNEAA